jgi:hypothetical protein
MLPLLLTAEGRPTSTSSGALDSFVEARNGHVGQVMDESDRKRAVSIKGSSLQRRPRPLLRKVKGYVVHSTEHRSSQGRCGSVGSASKTKHSAQPIFGRSSSLAFPQCPSGTRFGLYKYLAEASRDQHTNGHSFSRLNGSGDESRTRRYSRIVAV